MHLGHAFSALTAWDMAAEAGGAFLLRLEDIDRARCRPEHEAAMLDDLRWLGLTWPEPPLRQSSRLPAHRAALQALWDRGLLFPCTCSRRDIQAAASAPHGPPIGPDGIVYPGTCRGRSRAGPMPEGALRLDMAAAAMALTFHDTGAEVTVDPARLMSEIGDVVLARRDFGTSYHLAVVVDDAHQGITHVVRGADLRDATAIHVLLQRLLGLATPAYHHHRLILDERGRRLAKRDDARALARYRAEGLGPGAIRRLVGL